MGYGSPARHAAHAYVHNIMHAYVHNIFSTPPDGNYYRRHPLRQDQVAFDVTAAYIINSIYFDTDVTAVQFHPAYDALPWERVWVTVRRGNK